MTRQPHPGACPQRRGPRRWSRPTTSRPNIAMAERRRPGSRQRVRQRRTTSASAIPVIPTLSESTPTLSESTSPAIGMRTVRSQCSPTSRGSPRPSEGTTSTSPSTAACTLVRRQVVRRAISLLRRVARILAAVTTEIAEHVLPERLRSNPRVVHRTKAHPVPRCPRGSRSTSTLGLGWTTSPVSSPGEPVANAQSPGPAPPAPVTAR